MKYPIFVLVLSGGAFLEAQQAEIQREELPKDRFIPMATPVRMSTFLPGKDIRISARTLKQEIQFWAHQLREHLVYMNQGIKSKRFNDQGKKLHVQLRRLENQLKQQQPDRAFINRYMRLLRDIRTHNAQAYRMARGKKALRALLKHMLEELDYHRENVQGKNRSRAQEIHFWTRHDNEVLSLKKMKPTVSSEEQVVMKQLEKLGMDNHEKREDRYAADRMSRK